MKRKNQRLIPAHAGKTTWMTPCSRPRAAHPRSRGENLTWTGQPYRNPGSSPLTRGKRHEPKVRAEPRRLIPAHAGKTNWLTKGDGPIPAHPRSRGENLVSQTTPGTHGGSSPLTRGKLTRRGRHARPVRLIPAHAGKTRLLRVSARSGWAHPRSRGENGDQNQPVVRGRGSSPLTRGKLLQAAEVLLSRRLIPAHAGKTCAPRGYAQRRAAHPRSRGENKRPWMSWLRPAGSSPLTRGKQASRRPELAHARLIPAHAGKTADCQAQWRKWGAHPRSRGENRLVHWPTRQVMGSSPLTRGKRLSCGIRTWTGAAHPRSRGENTSSALHIWSQRGSSPLTRGKRLQVRRACPACRLIPAHAGKTKVGVLPVGTYEAHPRSRGENTS